MGHLSGERDWLIGVGGVGWRRQVPKGLSGALRWGPTAAAGLLCSGCVQGDTVLCGGRYQWNPEPDLSGGLHTQSVRAL